MTTHCIILAQGNQSRLGDSAHAPKCLLQLPGCNGTPILTRTLTQVWKLLGGVGINEVGLEYNSNHVTVVSWYEVRKHYQFFPVRIPPRSGNPFTFVPEIESLVDPGNSSLKGIARYLALAERSGRHDMMTSEHVRVRPLRDDTWPDRTVVLLGDVVYSWRCLAALFSTVGESNIMFAGTHDLGPGGGELWGIRWDRSANSLMAACLESALAKHPKFETYQPGQLRNWLWEVDRALPALVQGGNRSWYHATYAGDDYSMDIDLPEHIPLLKEASVRAAIDDGKHGVTW